MSRERRDEAGNREPEQDAGSDGDLAVETEPLPTHWDDAAASLAESFLCARTVRPEEAADLARFSHACLRYAYMERRVQGDLLCELPAHLSVLQGDEHAGLLEEAEELAEAERSCLEIPDGPIEELAELLDDRGIKVFEWPRAAGRELASAFLMAEETGPALLSLAPPDSPEGRFLLAHAYGHLVADIDPYENRFCPLGGGQGGLARGGQFAGEIEGGSDDGIAIPENRADIFARCLLIPHEHFARTLHDFGQGGPAGFSPQRLADVGYYYGVRPEVVLCRLVDLGVLPATSARALAGRLPAQRPEPAREAGPPREVGGTDGHALPGLVGALPRRFLNLSLALFLKGRVSKTQMGVLLGSGDELVDAILTWVPPPPPPARDGRRVQRPGPGRAGGGRGGSGGGPGA